jgi:hypothetical protein
MPTTVNFTSLIADLSNYLERGGSQTTDPTVSAQLPRLVNAAERKLAQMLKLLGQWEVLVDAPAGLQTGNPVLMKPDRWRATISMNYGAGATNNTRTTLLPRSYEYCRNYWPDSSASDAGNPPLYYSDYGYDAWLIAPTPDQDYPLEVNCYMQPPLLDATNQSNFWSNYTPNALLYGALVEAEPFLKEDGRLALWKQQWTDELQSLTSQDLQRLLDRTAERNRP